MSEGSVSGIGGADGSGPPAQARVDVRLVPPVLAAWAAAFAVPAIPQWVDAAGIGVTVSVAVLVVFVARRRDRVAAADGAVDGSGGGACETRGARFGGHAGGASGAGAKDASGGRDLATRGCWSAVAALVAAAAAATVATIHVAGARSGPIPSFAADARSASVELVPTTDPVVRASRDSRRPPYTTFRARIEMVQGGRSRVRTRTPVLVVADTHWRSVAPGQRIASRGRFATTEPTEREAAVFSPRSDPTLRQRAGPHQRIASDLRAGLARVSASAPGAGGVVLPALVVGDVSGFSTELVDEFRATGLTHVTAVSGANLSILLAFVLGIARWCGARLPTLTLFGLACVVAFVLLARPEPSVLRAAAMGVVALAGTVLGNRRQGVPALALAVIALVVIDPWLARSYGFALSVLATAGILLLAPSCARGLGRWMPPWCGLALAVPLAAQLVCTPVIALMSGKVSLVAVLANLLAAPVIAPATVLGFAALLVAPLWAGLASIIAWFGGTAASWVVIVAHIAADLPGAELPWSPTVSGIAGLVLVCFALVWALPRMLRRRWAGLLLGVGMVLALLRPVSPVDPTRWLDSWPPPDWRIVACDVGQGDAFVLRAGPDAAVLVDTGPEPGPIDRCLNDLGVRKLPYVMLTHFHADHVAGLLGAGRGRKVGEIGTSPVPRPAAEAREVRSWARDRNIPVTVAAAGQRRALGPHVRWTILWPENAAGEGEPAAGAYDADGTAAPGSGRGVDDEGSLANDASLVALAQVDGLRVLLTGDVEPAAQRQIVRAASGRDGQLRADVLKMPHHGSRYQDAGFLRAAGARIVVVSVGADNDYGHPAPTALRTLRDSRATVVRTDRDGTIALTGRGRQLATVRRRAANHTPSVRRGMLDADGSHEGIRQVRWAREYPSGRRARHRRARRGHRCARAGGIAGRTCGRCRGRGGTAG